MLSLSRNLGARLLFAMVLTTTVFGVSLAAVPTASAQAPPTQPPPSSIESGPSDILDDYQNAMGQWESAATGAAATLFALLAAIEVTWTAIVMTLEKTDMQAWVATFIKKLMGIGIFWALLKYGATWLPAIVNSFIQIGQNGSNQTALNPSSILVEGLNISGKLFGAAGQMGLSFDFGTALCLAFAGIGIFLSFAIVCVHFVMAMVESYIVLGAGYIFLGFGGSRWTSSYVERYIGLAVNVRRAPDGAVLVDRAGTDFRDAVGNQGRIDPIHERRRANGLRSFGVNADLRGCLLDRSEAGWKHHGRLAFSQWRRFGSDGCSRRGGRPYCGGGACNRRCCGCRSTR